MDINKRLKSLGERGRSLAVDNIFPFWAGDMLLDKENGGFYGLVTRDMEIVKDEPKALVLNGRMVYAFSKAYAAFGTPLYLERAKRGYDYIMKFFHDPVYGGAYSKVSCTGEAVDDSKPLYSEAFYLLAAASYYAASKDEEAKKAALDMFELIETKAKIAPGVYKGNFTRDWTEVPRQGFGGGMSLPEGAVMFQHHLCQAYETLYRATGDERVKKTIEEICVFIAEHLYNGERKCFKGLMDADYNSVGSRHSYGHDFEISYMALDMAELTGNGLLYEKMKSICQEVLYTVKDNAIDAYGGAEGSIDFETGEKSPVHVWWAQAEGVSAMLCGYNLTGDWGFLDMCEKLLDYIDKYFVDSVNGDWFNNVRVDADGYSVVDGSHGFDKLSAGKCPFHNSHMCFELVDKTGRA